MDELAIPPHPSTITKEALHPSQPVYINASPHPLSTEQVPANAAEYSITHTAHPVTRVFNQTGHVDHIDIHVEPYVAASPGHATQPLEGNRVVIPLLFQHTQPTSHTRRNQQPTEGPSKRDGSIAMDRCAISGCASPIIESGHIAAMHGSKEASSPCS